jgi:putative toxin-antitoxin system antitoxin component (TIGR02293 family)
VANLKRLQVKGLSLKKIKPMVTYETPYEKIITALGGAEVVGKNLRSVADLTDLVKRGLKKRSVYPVSKYLGISPRQMIQTLNVEDSPFEDLDDDDYLDSNVSERIIKLAEIISRGQEVFGEDKYFRSWMKDDLPALGSKKPIDYLGTFTGQEYILTILGRIEHGVFS